MRATSLLGVAALTLAATAWCHAATVDSGIEAGGRIGPYRATKCAGVDGGIKVGKALCFT